MLTCSWPLHFTRWVHAVDPSLPVGRSQPHCCARYGARSSLAYRRAQTFRVFLPTPPWHKCSAIHSGAFMVALLLACAAFVPRFCAAFARKRGPSIVVPIRPWIPRPTPFFDTWFTSRVPCLRMFVRFSLICLTCLQMAAEDGCFSVEVPVSDEGCGQDLRDGSQLRRQHGLLHQGTQQPALQSRFP